jgi:hypothetical protein
MAPSYFNKIKFESKVPEEIHQHLKVIQFHIKIWRFQEEKNSGEGAKCFPVELGKLEEKKFSFKSDEAYLLLLIYKSGKEGNCLITSGDCDLATFPHSIWGIVESTLQNLSPRGLLNSISSND